MNTARAFGPAVVSGFPNDSHWIVSRVFSTLAISLFRGSISGSALSAKIELLGRQKEKDSLDISLSAHSEGQILTITQQIHIQYWLGPFLGALLSTAFYITLIQYVMGPRRAWEVSYFCTVRGSALMQRKLLYCSLLWAPQLPVLDPQPWARGDRAQTIASRSRGRHTRRGSWHARRQRSVMCGSGTLIGR